MTAVAAAEGVSKAGAGPLAEATLQTTESKRMEYHRLGLTSAP
jgi:hypothetical protein